MLGMSAERTFKAKLLNKYSRSQVKILLQNQNVKKEGKIISDASYKVKEGEEYIISIPHIQQTTYQPENIPLNIEYEDGSKEILYIPLAIMRGEKKNEFDDFKRTVYSDWPWTHSYYTLTIPQEADKIKSLVIDPSQRMADIDRLEDPNEPLSSDLKKAPPSFSTNYIGMNTSEPPFDDVKVRQALNYAINKQEIATLVLADLVTPAKGILPPGFPAYNRELKGYHFDPEKAQLLLGESRYGTDMENFPPIVLTVSGGFGASVGLDLEVILESWRQVLGIEVEIQQTE